MHLYVMARGIAPRLNQWENDLLATHYSFKHNADQPVGLLQLGVRPIRLYELAFPEEHLSNVLQKIQPSGSWNPAYDKYIAIIRKLMRLEKIPEVPKADINNFLYRDFVEATAIGVKRDSFMNPTKGIEQI